MSRGQEIVIWVLINIVLALVFSRFNIWLHQNSENFYLDYALGSSFSTLLVILNLCRMYFSAHLKVLYGAAIVANHASIFVTGDYSFLHSLMNIMSRLQL